MTVSLTHTYTHTHSHTHIHTQHQDTTSDQSTAEEMGLSGATAEDVEAEMMKRVCEQEVMGTGLLASFEPVIVGVVVSPSLYPCPALQASAALALAKFMLVR